MSAPGHRTVLWAAFIGMGGWVVLMAGWLWWTFQPVALPAVVEPIRILNEGREVAIGEAIVMRLEVSKPPGARTLQSTRFISCESGNLITLTASVKDLPAGRYTVVSDSVILPAKVAPGDECRFTFRNTYAVNPIRDETVEWSSEEFKVLPAVKAG